MDATRRGLHRWIDPSLFPLLSLIQVLDLAATFFQTFLNQRDHINYTDLTDGSKADEVTLLHPLQCKP